MPLALQAILPVLVLLVAAVVVSLRRGNANNGWVASGATAVGAITALIELLRLAPGEHVDVPYLTTFPYADLVIRLDGLSLAFATVTLITAAFLMLARQGDADDRRNPWTGWLLTTAAACGLMLAGNLLLLYVLLQVLTLAWSGALDEAAPRRRRLRLTLQVADVGLLLAAASAIQSVGTSSFSGVPSDTFGVASFWLMMLPVLARVGVLASGTGRPLAPVAFGPSIAWVGPAGYMMMRLLALLGGRLPDRPTAVLLFVVAALAAIAFATAAFWSARLRLSSLLLAAQAAVAIALSSGSEPLLTVGAAWMWLLLVPLAALASVRTASRPLSELLTRTQLSMLPGTIGFTGVWLGALTLHALGLLPAITPLAIAIVISALASIGQLPRPGGLRADPVMLGAAALGLIAAFPIVALNPIVLPAATAVRFIPAGTASASPLGISSNLGTWPALVVFIAAALMVGAADRFRRPLSNTTMLRLLGRARMPRTFPLIGWADLGQSTARRTIARAVLNRWSPMALWAAFAVVVILSLARP